MWFLIILQLNATFKPNGVFKEYRGITTVLQADFKKESECNDVLEKYKSVNRQLIRSGEIVPECITWTNQEKKNKTFDIKDDVEQVKFKDMEITI